MAGRAKSTNKTNKKQAKVVAGLPADHQRVNPHQPNPPAPLLANLHPQQLAILKRFLHSHRTKNKVF